MAEKSRRDGNRGGGQDGSWLSMLDNVSSIIIAEDTVTGGRRADDAPSSIPLTDRNCAYCTHCYSMNAGVKTFTSDHI